MKRNKLTSLSTMFYVFMFSIGLLLIILHTLISISDFVKVFFSSLVLNLIEFNAAGIFPAIVVALMTDAITTKLKKDNYKKFCEYSLQKLKIMCEDLPATVHACAADLFSNDDDYDIKKTFCGWCNYLNEKKDSEQIKYLRQEVRSVETECRIALDKLETYEEYRDDEKISSIKSLIEGCKSFYREGDENGKITGHDTCHPDKFVQAVLKLFPTDSEENKCIKLGYVDKFNSDDYVV